MTQRTALTIAAALTAFMLVLAGGLAMIIMQPQKTAATSEGATAPAAAAGLDPATVQAMIDERDAAYAQQLQQADQQLREANDRLSQAYAQLEKQNAQQLSPTPQAQPQPEQSQQPAYPVSAQNALAIAQGAAPGARPLKAPELVDFQGATAYEVSFNLGLVYVDATSGQVLYNGATAAFPSTRAIQVTGNSGNDSNEHEGGGDD